MNYNLAVVNRFFHPEKIDRLAKLFKKVEPVEPKLVESLEGYVGGDTPKKECIGDSLLEALDNALYDLGLTMSGGRFYQTCCVCGEESELECDIEEFDKDMSYCGGSPSCCP